MSKFIKKIFQFPSPKDLGLSNSNSLPLRKLTPDAKQFSWEDYDNYIKKTYPIKYFLLETLYNYIKYNIFYKAYIPLYKIYHFMLCHFVPSRKYHLLDLRQKENKFSVDVYRYGWIEIPEKMTYAMFNLLTEFVENSQKIDFNQFSEEDLKNDPGLRQQKLLFDESQEIYNWWHIERKKDLNEINNLYKDFDIALNSKNLNLKNDLLELIRAKESSMEYKTDQMLERILKIRKGLWY